MALSRLLLISPGLVWPHETRGQGRNESVCERCCQGAGKGVDWDMRGGVVSMFATIY